VPGSNKYSDISMAWVLTGAVICTHAIGGQSGDLEMNAMGRNLGLTALINHGCEETRQYTGCGKPMQVIVRVPQMALRQMEKVKARTSVATRMSLILV